MTSSTLVTASPASASTRAVPPEATSSTSRSANAVANATRPVLSIRRQDRAPDRLHVAHAFLPRDRTARPSTTRRPCNNARTAAGRSRCSSGVGHEARANPSRRRRGPRSPPAARSDHGRPVRRPGSTVTPVTFTPQASASRTACDPGERRAAAPDARSGPRPGKASKKPALSSRMNPASHDHVDPVGEQEVAHGLGRTSSRSGWASTSTTSTATSRAVGPFERTHVRAVGQDQGDVRSHTGGRRAAPAGSCLRRTPAPRPVHPWKRPRYQTPGRPIPAPTSVPVALDPRGSAGGHHREEMPLLRRDDPGRGHQVPVLPQRSHRGAAVVFHVGYDEPCAVPVLERGGCRHALRRCRRRTLLAHA